MPFSTELRCAVIALVTLVNVAQAQSPYVIRAPHWTWRTVELSHWIVHYPASAQEFASCLVPRLESIHRSVAGLAGYPGPTKTTLVISDGQGLDGAYASANARAPVIVLNTQPSAPRSAGWSDCAIARVTHELTHILQLSRPWSEQHPLWVRAAMRLLPAEPGPIVLRRKPWLRESYAEHVEGILTPTGAPYTTPRANAIRRLADTSRFPRYAALDLTYDGRYLVGAAFVDELAQRAGEKEFARLWERMAAPDWAGDDVEFRRLLGDSPQALYAAFTRRAIDRSTVVAERIRTAGIIAGREVRRVGWTDYVALSPDGSTLAAVYGQPLLQLTLSAARDSSEPTKRFPLPTGQSPNAPRFTPDGKRVVFIAWELISDGIWRPDVYEWDIARTSLRRVTRGAGIRDLDPATDGRFAVGTRCDFGICDLVRIDLRDGSRDVVARGAPDRMFHRPRISRDGRIVVAVQEGPRSRVALVSDLGELQYIDADDGAWRYEPAFLRDGRVVVVSDATGIPALEILDPRSSARRALTRGVDPAYAPEPDPASDSVYYIAATRSGSVVRKVSIADGSPTFVQLRDSTLAPAVPLPLESLPAFAAGATPPSRAYGLGPRFFSVLPGGTWSADGVTGGLQLWTSDIVGRFSAMASAHFGQHRALHGFGVTGVLRATRMPVIADVAFAEQAFRASSVTDSEMDYLGGSLRTEWNRGPWSRRQQGSLGAAYSRVDFIDLPVRRLHRVFAGGTYGVRFTQVANWYAAQQLTVGAFGGATADTTWGRWTGAARLEAGRIDRGALLSVAATAGVTTERTPAFERFMVGGAAPVLVGDIALSQRISQPLLRTGALSGRRVVALGVDGPKVGPLTPFLWSGAADSVANRQSLAGLALTFLDDPRRNWRVPGVQLRLSAGYLFGGSKGVRSAISASYAQ